jgi:beta-mannosidase
MNQTSLLRYFYAIACLFSAGIITGRSTETLQTLDQGWVLHQTNQKTVPAKVPGGVFTDLFNAGVIPDPFVAANEAEVQWVSRQDWAWSTTFVVNSRLWQRKSIDLVFNGLDTYAEVFLNGTRILNADNQFRTWRVDVKELLQKGINRLEVRIRSPYTVQDSLQQLYGLALPEDHRVFTRKGQWQYAWDWAPALPSMGIWKPVELHGYDAVRLSGVSFVQEFENNVLSGMKARFTINTKKTTTLELEVRNPDIRPARLTVTADSGEHVFEIPITFSKPVRYWMPAGYGDQPLYEFFCSLIGSGDILVAEKQIVTGIRQVELVQEPDHYGSSFYFRVNGLPVFAKGANWVPADHFPERATPETYRRLISEAEFAGMNMLRVWGGGIYEDDLFYTLCDSSGIMVWQDFMFACGMYPGSPPFLSNVAQEAQEQLLRLANHPAIVLWCGNNEVSEGWHRWGWSTRFSPTDSARVWRSYLAIFEELLPDLVKHHAPGLPYWPSSPSLGRGDHRHIYSGDAHYWGVWHDAEPFDMFRRKVPRFMSEFGFQSYPHPSSLQRFIPDTAMYTGSVAMKMHQKHARGDQLITQYMKDWFPEPTGFEQYVMMSQWLQAEGVVTGIMAHREAKPWCMGTLYWQFNDCWPAVSWSSVDYYGMRKALHYRVRDAYAPTIATVNIHQQEIELVLINDDPKLDSVWLELEIMDHAGNRIFIWKEQVPAPFTRNLRRSWPIQSIVSQSKDSLLFVVRVFKNDVMISERVTLPVKPTTLPVVNSTLESVIGAKLAVSETGTSITFTSERFVYGVWVEVAGEAVNFSDNYFHLLPGRSKTIHCNEKIMFSDLKISNLIR